MCISWVAQSCLTLCNPMDYSPPGSSVLGILQARILEWVAIPFSRDETQGWKPGLLHCRRILYHLCNQGSPLPHYMKIIIYGPCTSEGRNLLYVPGTQQRAWHKAPLMLATLNWTELNLPGFLLSRALHWRRQWHPTPLLLPGKSHGWRTRVGCSPWCR